MAKYYATFVKDEFGLIIIKGTYINDKYSQTFLNQPGTAFDAQAKAKVAKGIMPEHTNQLREEQDGSTENRVRFITEIAMKIKQSVGLYFHVGIRISSAKTNDYVYKCSEKEADEKKFFDLLAEAGLDFFHVND